MLFFLIYTPNQGGGKMKKILSARVSENEHTAIRKYCIDKKTSVQKIIVRLLKPYMRIK